MENFITFLTGLDKLAWILGGVTLLFSITLYYLHKASDNDFDLTHLIKDSNNNRVSLGKFGQLIALAISSWGFVYLVLHDRLTELYFTTYMGIWAATKVVDKALTTLKDKNTNA